MPLNEAQRRVFAIIAKNRSSESYVAGATVLHRNPSTVRFTDDIDLFHDESDSVASAAESDVAALEAAGFKVMFDMQHPLQKGSFARAEVTGDNFGIKLEWDSAFRFFPLVQDDVLGWRLHDVDAAANKVLACVGRTKIRDFVDIIALDAEFLPLGRIIWAACGKDTGWTPDMILNEITRTAKLREEHLQRITWARPMTLVELKTAWLSAKERASDMVLQFPPSTLGALFVDASGWPVTSAEYDQAQETPHYGSMRGAWPRVVETDE
jgi:hypothetical protein